MQLQDIRREFTEQFAAVTKQLCELERRVDLMEKRSIAVKFPVETTVAMINVQEEPKENLKNVCGKIFREGMGITDISPICYERVKSNSNKPSLVKVELWSPEEKRALLRAKRKLRESHQYRNVFIRSSQTYTERIMRSNLKTILAEIPRGSEYKLTANGRILKNEQTSSQPDEQSVVREDRQESSRDNTQDNKDSQNNHTERVGEEQSSNLMDSENHESSAIQYGHPDDSKVNPDNDHPLKSSDQVNAIDTTAPFTLSDDEVDDIKLSMTLNIQKAGPSLTTSGIIEWI